MAKLPVLSGKELITVLKGIGFKVVRRKGSHISLQKGICKTVVPLHDELARGTLLGILKQCGLSKEDLITQMSNELSALLEESIKLERNLAALYMLFADIFSENRDFWWQLSLEEQNHASIIKSAMSQLKPIGVFPEKILCEKLEELRQMNGKIEKLLKEYKHQSITENNAFHMALHLEESCGELHFQQAMDEPSDSAVIKLLQEMNKNDKDHAERIRTFMREKGREK